MIDNKMTGLAVLIAGQMLYADKAVMPALNAFTSPQSPIVAQMERQARPMDMLLAMNDGRELKVSEMPREMAQLRAALEKSAASPTVIAGGSAAAQDAVRRIVESMREGFAAGKHIDLEGAQGASEMVLREALESETARAMELERRLEHADMLIQRLINEGR